MYRGEIYLLYHQYTANGKHFFSMYRNAKEVMTFMYHNRFFPCFPFTFFQTEIFIIPISISNVF